MTAPAARPGPPGHWIRPTPPTRDPVRAIRSRTDFRNLFAGVIGHPLEGRALRDSLEHRGSRNKIAPRCHITFGRTIREAEHPGWCAYRQGRYDEARGLLAHGLATDDVHTRWVHVIADDARAFQTPWDMARLHQRARLGQRIRIVHADVLGALGVDPAGIPDIVLKPGNVVFTLTTGDDGIATGGTRYRDHGLKVRCRALFEVLFEQGVRVGDHLARCPVPWPDHRPGLLTPEPHRHPYNILDPSTEPTVSGDPA